MCLGDEAILPIPLIEEIIGLLKATREKGSKLYAANPQSRHTCKQPSPGLVGLAEILGVGWHNTKTWPISGSSGVWSPHAAVC